MFEIKIAGLLELFKQYLVVQRKASQAMFSMAELIISSCSGGTVHACQPNKPPALSSATTAKDKSILRMPLHTELCLLWQDQGGAV